MSTFWQVSRTAKMMITQGGFSKKLGQVAWTSGQQNTFVGQQMGQPSDCSGETSDEIDQEVKALVDRAYRYSPQPNLFKTKFKYCGELQSQSCIALHCVKGR